MPPLLIAIVASACLGALVGLIRQWSDQKSGAAEIDFGGVRTYSFWAMLGCVGAYASDLTSPALLAVIFAIVGAQQIAIRFAPTPDAARGGTTFASTLLTLLTGCLVFWDELSAAVLVAATVMVLLGSKQPLHAWTRSFTQDDVRGTLQFAAITGVILPLVPNRDMGPFAAFNPFSTWLMVVLISGLGFAGYLAMRLLGARAGVIATSLLGGLASSTATTLAFTRRSRDEPDLAEHYALAVTIACTVMLPRVIVAIAVINRDLALTLIAPFAIMAAPGLLYAAFVWWRKHPGKTAGEAVPLRNPLNLKMAIKFAVLYAVIAFLVKAAPQLGLAQSLLPLSFVSGLTDMDAISLSMARNGAGEGNPPELATHAVVLAAIANTLLKGGLAISLGSPGLRVRIALVLGATALAGAAWLLFA
jgi:uncharacterized membrane protein (DUF4010 family)